jgi:hypothetical protein
MIFLVILLYGLWKLFHSAFTYVQGLQPQLAVAIVAGSVTVIVSVISILLAKYYENKRFIDKDIRDKKIPVYEKLFTYFFSYIAFKDKSSLKTMDEFFIEFAPQFVIWGSDDVIIQWVNFRKKAGDGDVVVTALEFEKLVLAIRKDIGHFNKGIKNDGTLLSVFINDIDQLIKK